ncbi:MAG: family 10 glycosylhydrolase [Vicinamibacterales bacterium]
MRASTLAVLVGVCALAGHPSGLAGPPVSALTVQTRSPEVRALWVLRTSLSSPAAVQQLIQSARDNGFNALLVQIRGRGDAYYQSRLEPRSADLSRQPDSFDPLASVIEAARPAGLQVHAWVNVNLVSSAVDLPGAREHLIHRHPEWLMVPRDLAQDLATVDPESPAYVGKLARWTRGQAAGIEGLYSSPLVPAAVEHTVAVVRDITKRYRIDGVHLDYIRYPTERFDYSRAAIRAFNATIRPKLTAAVRRDLDSLERDDLFAYPDAFPGEWRQFRVDRLTALVRRLRDTVKEERQDALVTVATAPDLQEARERRLQDWGAWLESGLVDAVCPMAYTPEAARFAEHIAAARQAAGERPIWAGIGAYRLTPTQTVENIQAARKLGASGIVLFSYDSMTDPRQSAPDYLAIVSRAAFGRRVAATGSR